MYQTPSVKRIGRIEDLTGFDFGGWAIDVAFMPHSCSC